MAHVHFLTFGDGSPQIRGAAARLRREALRTGIFIEASVYHLKRIRDEYPVFWKQHGNFLLTAKRGLGYFLWKPFLMSAKLNEIAENDFLVYADAGCEFVPGNSQELIDWLPTEPEFELSAIPLDSFHTNVRWTNGRCLACLDNTREFLEQPMFAATFMFLRNNSRSRDLAAKWLEWSVHDDYCCLVDRQGDLERPEFEGHRHDQSIFSLLAYALEHKREIGIKRIGIEKTVDEKAVIQGARNKTPFRSIGVNRYKRKILSKCYSATVKLFWNENRYRADLYESREK